MSKLKNHMKELKPDDYDARLRKTFTTDEIERTGRMLLDYEYGLQITMVPIVTTKNNADGIFTHFALSYPYSLARMLADGDLIKAVDLFTARGIHCEFHEVPDTVPEHMKHLYEAHFVVAWPLLDFLHLADVWADDDADGFTVCIPRDHGIITGTLPYFH